VSTERREGSLTAEDNFFSGESANVEYKVEVPEKSEKYMKTVVAFSNGRGGRIVFGIDDKTMEVVGIRAYFVDRREYDGPIQRQVEAAFLYVLEKINMGMLLNTVSLKKMVEGYSKLRNPAIANAFAYMKIIEKWGTGIPKILRECREYGLPEPKLVDFDGDFRANMYRRAAMTEAQEIVRDDASAIWETTQTTQTPTQTIQTTQTPTQTPKEDLTDNDKDILKMIQYDPSLTQKQIALELGWTVSRVKYYLNKMKRLGIIKRVGSSHNGYWELMW